MIRWKALIVNLAIPLAVGGLAGFLTQNAMESFTSAAQPPGSPPAIVFPIVWTVLYLLMGVSSYLVWISPKNPMRQAAFSLYAVQLAVNFLWPVVFFTVHAYLIALVILAVLWALVLWMIIAFFRIRPAAGWLQIPYLLWLTYAAYLNLGVWLLNR